MTKIFLLTLIVFTGFAFSGCSTTPEARFDPIKIDLTDKIPVEPALPLENVVAQNDKAIDLAAKKVDFLANDRFLTYINEAKDRDEAKRRTDAFVSLSAQIEAIR